MAGSADVNGTQHYQYAIGHPKIDPAQPIAPSDGSGGSAGVNKLGISIPAGWGANWAAKLAAAKAGTGLARLGMLGDSLTAGQWSSNLDTKNLSGLLRQSLQTTYGDGGSGFKSTYDTTTCIATAGYTTGAFALSSLIATTGTWGTVTSVADGPGASPIYGNTNGATATYIVRGTLVETFVQQRSTANGAIYTVQIDGGAVQGPYATANLTDAMQRRSWTVAPGNHTVVVTVTDVTLGGLAFNGVRGSNATGVVVDKYGRGAYPGRAFKNGTNFTFQSASGATIGGAVQGTIAQAGQWSGGSANPCDLAIWSFGINEARTSGGILTPDGWMGNLRDYLDDVKEGSNGATDVMILMQHMGLKSSYDAATYNYALYCERGADLARSYGAAFVNLWPIGNNSYNWMVAQGFMGNSASAGVGGSDSVHLSDAGFQWQHDIIKPLIAL